MTERQRIAFVFRRALEHRQDEDGTVLVQARDLVTGCGAARARDLFGVDAAAIDQAVATARHARLVELDREIGELEQMLAAGFRDARKELQASRAERQKIQSGALLPKPLVSVRIGTLRQWAREALRQG